MIKHPDPEQLAAFDQPLRDRDILLARLGVAAYAELRIGGAMQTSGLCAPILVALAFRWLRWPLDSA